MKRSKVRIIVSIAVVVFVFLTVLFVAKGIKKRNEERTINSIVKAVEDNTEDKGRYVVGIIPTKNNIGHKVWYVLMLDDDEDTTVYLVSEYAGQYNVLTVGTIE